jgi:hypothetical protein
MNNWMELITTGEPLMLQLACGADLSLTRIAHGRYGLSYRNCCLPGRDSG